MREYELKLATGRVVTWDGQDGPDAARRYVAGHPEAVVVATRPSRREIYGLFIGARPVIEPGDERWRRR